MSESDVRIRSPNPTSESEVRVRLPTRISESGSDLRVGPRHRYSASAIGIGMTLDGVAPGGGRRALSSCALNIAEGNRSEGGLRVSRFWTAAGSNEEARAGLRVAVAWGYVSTRDVEAGEALLDRVAAMLYRLGARR